MKKSVIAAVVLLLMFSSFVYCAVEYKDADLTDKKIAHTKASNIRVTGAAIEFCDDAGEEAVPGYYIINMFHPDYKTSEDRLVFGLFAYVPEAVISRADLAFLKVMDLNGQGFEIKMSAGKEGKLASNFVVDSIKSLDADANKGMNEVNQKSENINKLIKAQDDANAGKKNAKENVPARMSSEEAGGSIEKYTAKSLAAAIQAKRQCGGQITAVVVSIKDSADFKEVVEVVLKDTTGSVTIYFPAKRAGRISEGMKVTAKGRVQAYEGKHIFMGIIARPER